MKSREGTRAHLWVALGVTAALLVAACSPAPPAPPPTTKPPTTTSSTTSTTSTTTTTTTTSTTTTSTTSTTTTSTTTTTQVPPPGQAVAVSAGAIHTCFTLADATVRCSGTTASGGAAGAVPAEVPAHEGRTLGRGARCSIGPHGDVSCWGANLDPDPGVSGASVVAAQSRLGCAVVAGEVVCWGDGSSPPRKVPGLAGVVDLGLGDDDSVCVLRAEGTVACWGNDRNGRLGNGSAGSSSTPTEVVGIDDAVSLAVGEEHACVVRSDQTVWCWGHNRHFQVTGNPVLPDGFAVHTPVRVARIAGASALLTVGLNHSCVVLLDTTVRCWGGNTEGYLGDGTKVARGSAVTVEGLSGVVAISAGRWHTCALTADGAPRCWGDNHAGQLGDGSFLDRWSPTPVLLGT